MPTRFEIAFALRAVPIALKDAEINSAKEFESSLTCREEVGRLVCACTFRFHAAPPSSGLLVLSFRRAISSASLTDSTPPKSRFKTSLIGAVTDGC
jgi:hypothetical protein